MLATAHHTQSGTSSDSDGDCENSDSDGDDSYDDTGSGGDGDDDDDDVISTSSNEVVRRVGCWSPSSSSTDGEEVVTVALIQHSRRGAVMGEVTRSGSGDDDDSDDDAGSGSDGDYDGLIFISNEVISQAGCWSPSSSSTDGEEVMAASIRHSRRGAVIGEVTQSESGDGDGDSSEDKRISPTSSTRSGSWACHWGCPGLLGSWLRDAIFSRIRSDSSPLGDESFPLNGESDRELRDSDDDDDDDDDDDPAGSDDSWPVESMARGERSRPRRFSAPPFTSTRTWIAGHSRRGRVSSFGSRSESIDATASQNPSTMGTVTAEGQHCVVLELYPLSWESYEGDSYWEEDSDTDEGVQVDDDEDCDSVG